MKSMKSFIMKLRINLRISLSEQSGINKNLNLKGACIELVIAGTQAEFDINKRNIKESKLAVSQQLLDIARNVE